MRIFITGGMGYIGSNVCVELIKAGHTVAIYDNLHNSNTSVLDDIEAISGSRPFFMCGDILDFKPLYTSMLGYDMVIHLAGLKSVEEGERFPLTYFSVNSNGTLNVLNAMSIAGIDKIVFSSSATVYGNPKYLPIDLDHPTEPCTNYGRSKLAAETYIINSGYDYSILRYFNPICSRDGKLADISSTNLMPAINKVLNGEREYLEVYGNTYDTPDGTCVREYISVVDLAKHHVKALECFNDIKNLGSGKGTSVLEMAKMFNVPYKILPPRNGDIPSLYI